ncbi:MAG TPA: APC family permease [Gemmatimonadales bacterium]|nr:APC family permease [Gemmatimonadales bacterium]
MTARGRLLRVLGLAFGLAIILGNTIGQGILRTPGEIAARLPDEGWFLAVWAAGAVYALFGAVSLAELGAMIPRSGGQYVFVRRALGEYAGFVVGWSDWISSCGSAAAVAIVIGEYAGALVPPLAGAVPWTAAGVILAFTLVQWQGIVWGDRTQQVTSLLKALLLVALIVACFVLARPTAPAEPPPFPAGLGLVAAVVVALQGVIVTYDGWNGVIYFSEEVRDPGRDIPRSMVGGVLLVAAIYLLLNLAFLRVLPIGRMAGEPFVAGAAVEAIFGPRGATAIRVLVIVSLLSAANALLLIASRVPVALARDRLLPGGVAGVSESGAPRPALLASAALTAGFAVTGTFTTVLALLAFFFVFNYLLSFVSVFALRRREPATPRPYRAWGHPWTTGLAALGSLAFLAGSVLGDTRNSLGSLALLAASYPVYRVVRGWAAGD